MKTLLVCFCVLVVVLGGWLAWRGTRADAPRCSVLVVSIDTCRADSLGYLGRRLEDGSSPTPNLDVLAKRSRTREGVSPVPLTLPAHATLFSGLHPDRHGLRENDSFRLPSRAERGFSLLAEDLRDSGYDTAAFVSGQPLERAFGLDSGFRAWVQPGRADGPADRLRFRERSAPQTTEDVLHYLAGVGDRPFFLFVHYFDPHDPYVRPLEHAGLPRTRDGDYLSEIMLVDREVGRILSALPDEGCNTLVIVIGDHGEGLGEHEEQTHGYLLHQSTLRVPFLLCAPGQGPPSGVEPSLPGRLEDVQPTVLAYAGAEGDGVKRDGRNLLDSADSGPWYAYAETLYPYYQFQFAHLRSCQDPTWKLITGGGRDELFRWRDDRGELENLAAKHPEEVRRLREHLDFRSARRAQGRAENIRVTGDATTPYMGGRPQAFPLEPGAQENDLLPRVDDRWGLVHALEQARSFLRPPGPRPWDAAMTLAPFAPECQSNPALSWWTARSLQLWGRLGKDQSVETRVGKLDEARRQYRSHFARFRDPRAVDAELSVLLDRHDVTGAREDLEGLVKLATGEIQAGGGRSLTHGLRGRAFELLGALEDALADYQAAARLDPGDPQPRRDAERLGAQMAEMVPR